MFMKCAYLIYWCAVNAFQTRYRYCTHNIIIISLMVRRFWDVWRMENAYKWFICINVSSSCWKFMVNSFFILSACDMGGCLWKIAMHQNWPHISSFFDFFFVFAFFYNNTLWNEFKKHQIFHIVWITESIETKQTFTHLWRYIVSIFSFWSKSIFLRAWVENSLEVHIRCALLVKFELHSVNLKFVGFQQCNL